MAINTKICTKLLEQEVPNLQITINWENTTLHLPHPVSALPSVFLDVCFWALTVRNRTNWVPQLSVRPTGLQGGYMAFAWSHCASVLQFTKRRRWPNKSPQMCLDVIGLFVWTQHPGKDFYHSQEGNSSVINCICGAERVLRLTLALNQVSS